MIATPRVGSVSEKTVGRWLRGANQAAGLVNGLLAEELLSLSPGLDLSGLAVGTRARLGALRTLLRFSDIYRRLTMALGAAGAVFSVGLFGFLNARFLPISSKYL